MRATGHKHRDQTMPIFFFSDSNRKSFQKLLAVEARENCGPTSIRFVQSISFPSTSLPDHVGTDLSSTCCFLALPVCPREGVPLDGDSRRTPRNGGEQEQVCAPVPARCSFLTYGIYSGKIMAEIV